ncbi:MAG: transferase, partial [Nocardioides sp.]
LHGGADYLARYDAWLSWFDEQRIEGVGFGWINIHAMPGDQTFLDWPYDVEQPIAPTIGAWSEAVQQLRGLGDEDLLAAHPVTASDVRQETYGWPGETDPETIVLRQQRGFRRGRTADTVVAGFVGAADGDLSTVQLLDALATLLARDPVELRTAYLPVLRELVAEGFLRA